MKQLSAAIALMLLSSVTSALTPDDIMSSWKLVLSERVDGVGNMRCTYQMKLAMARAYTRSMQLYHATCSEARGTDAHVDAPSAGRMNRASGDELCGLFFPVQIPELSLQLTHCRQHGVRKRRSVTLAQVADSGSFSSSTAVELFGRLAENECGAMPRGRRQLAEETREL